ncbi:hypothetical protein F5877DRAFT_70168 [Lentinula edodes]|nr:hypothetical protein F5877DRAFT_70168 [Lentinula edodes]
MRDPIRDGRRTDAGGTETGDRSKFIGKNGGELSGVYDAGIKDDGSGAEVWVKFWKKQIEEKLVQKEKKEEMEQYYDEVEKCCNEEKNESSEEERKQRSCVPVPDPSVTWHEKLDAYMRANVGRDERE